jgi:uncharacterized protein YndB with AHSA1/START domain
MVKFEQHTQIDAAVEAVWSVLADPRTWPTWFPDVDRIANLGAVEAGSSFEWHEGNDTGAGSIVRVDKQRQLRVVTSGKGPAVTHTFDLGHAGGVLGVGGNDTRLEYIREYDPPGGFIMDIVAGGNPVDLLKVKGTLEKVKALAEGKAVR